MFVALSKFTSSNDSSYQLLDQVDVMLEQYKYSRFSKYLSNIIDTRQKQLVM